MGQRGNEQKIMDIMLDIILDIIPVWKNKEGIPTRM